MGGGNGKGASLDTQRPFLHATSIDGGRAHRRVEERAGADGAQAGCEGGGAAMVAPQRRAGRMQLDGGRGVRGQAGPGPNK
eukprot:1181456-Prorocentrum_minimum.AAC.3